MATRNQTQVYLPESLIPEFTGTKLPSLRMILRLFLHHHLELKKTIRESSAFTVQELSKFWQMARIPMRDHQNCQTKIEKSFEMWRLLKKTRHGKQRPRMLARIRSSHLWMTCLMLLMPTHCVIFRQSRGKKLFLLKIYIYHYS